MEKIVNLVILSVMVRAELTCKGQWQILALQSQLVMCLWMSYVVLQQKHLSDTLNLWLSFGYCNKEDQHFVYSIIVVHKAGFLHYIFYITIEASNTCK